ncbi:hypothetical protein [Streptomyces sp. NPDC000134]|uniref:hypothetical protein n=1 Tax=Streptomyces sp. NPDC000134 TaxID=3364536 RepID=UPI0036A2ACC5
MTHPVASAQAGGNVSLCTGSAALDQAVKAVTGLPTVLVGEKDPAASRLLAIHAYTLLLNTLAAPVEAAA